MMSLKYIGSFRSRNYSLDNRLMFLLSFFLSFFQVMIFLILMKILTIYAYFSIEILYLVNIINYSNSISRYYFLESTTCGYLLTSSKKYAKSFFEKAALISKEIKQKGYV